MRHGLFFLLILLAACTSPTPIPATAPPIPATAPPIPATAPPPTEAATPLSESGFLHQDTVLAHEMPGGLGAWYTLQGEVGQAIYVEAAPQDSTLDLRIVMVAAGERELARIDHAGPGEPEVLAEFQFPLSTSYSLRIEAVEGTGPMEGKVEFLAADALTGGGHFASFEADPLAAEVAVPATFHVYTFEAERDTLAILRTLPEDDGLALYLHVFNPEGEILGLFEGQMKDQWLRQEGQYTVLVWARTGTGAYRLELAPGG